MKEKFQRWGVLGALGISVLVVVLLRLFRAEDLEWVRFFIQGCELMGKLFMNGLKMLVVPLITSAIICAMMHFGSEAEFRRLGIKTFLFYFLSCLIAAFLGLILANILRPGHTDAALAAKILGQANVLPENFVSFENAEHSKIGTFLLRLVPPNILKAATDNSQILGLITFSLLVGFFISRLPAKLRNVQIAFWEGIEHITQNITRIIIAFAPLGVFGLVTPILLHTGLELLYPLLYFVFTILLGFLIYSFFILYLMLRYVGKIRPWEHYKAMFPVVVMAFSTSSTAATLPFALQTVENTAKVSPKTARFTLPLGSVINMCGTALYECVVVIFIAQLYQTTQGIAFGLWDQLMVVLMALLTSVGVAGIPASGLIAITMILSSVGLPIESIGVIWTVERLLDMCRTAVNVFNDTCGTIIIARSEGEPTAYSGHQRRHPN